jgi:cytoplasmic iron level regulating protein YaaA (DUF328/UPF0246 family)
MLIVISPAKTLDSSPQSLVDKFTQPDFLEDSAELVTQLCQKSADDLCQMMNISEKLGVLNAERFAQWQTPFTDENAKPALLAFKGDVYLGLKAEEFNKRDFTYAQGHLRILSGLYGVLRPLDLMQAYRLEMGSKLDNSRGANLYEFWGGRITTALNQVLQKDRPKVLVNLASNEYFGAVKTKQLEGDLVTPSFKDAKNGKFKIISFFAKKARGTMASWIIRNRVKKIDDLKSFNEDDYAFNAEMSQGHELVFTRGSI